ncbi:MAG: EAL domain-containing protein [Cytophagales bacterium]|nr:EAL domain-containing protein [Armatimonadota bacterium]
MTRSNRADPIAFSALVPGETTAAAAAVAAASSAETDPFVAPVIAAVSPSLTAPQFETLSRRSLQRLVRALRATSVLLVLLGLGALWSLVAAGRERADSAAILSAAALVSRSNDSRLLAARMTARSEGGDRWGARYREAASAFVQSLKQLTAASEGAPAALSASGVIASGWACLSLEKQTLALAASGQGVPAVAALSNGRYVGMTDAFSRGLSQLSASQGQRLARIDLWQKVVLIACLSLAAAGGLLTAAMGLPAARRLALWRKTVSARLQEREKAQVVLEATQVRLQADLREQAQALAEARRELGEQIHLRKGSDAERQLLTQAVQSANDVIMITQAEEGMSPRVVYVNQAFERMTGYASSEIVGKSPRMLQGVLTDNRVLAYLRERRAAREPAQAEVLNYRRDGTTFWVELNIRPIVDETGFQTHWISIQREVTERKRAEEQIRWQATHDALTGLPNRLRYQDQLAEALALSDQRGSTVGILFFDLDRFKQINDTLGHGVGDKLLQEVARRLEGQLRAEDMIARIGGDEFAILIPYEEIEDAQICTSTTASVAQRLLDALDASFLIDGHEMYATASIGISIAPQDGTDIETLLKRADTAMYRAKDQGRDSYRVYTETMGARALDRLVLETNLRRALDRGEFFLLYQPQMDLITGRMVGAEALIRWDSPQLGLISPLQFIQIAEETGMIMGIGEWALREACQQAVRWELDGVPLRVSVNLSAHQFQQGGLVDAVAAALRDTGLPANCLDLELTEGTLLQEKEALMILNALKKLGVRLSVDDFGTGYSSFSYLRTFPFDVLKIDRSFITDLVEDRKSEIVVRNLVGMAHGIGLEVVAEGVETELQRNTLASMGCERFQGYLFSPPTTAAEVLALARRSTPTPRRDRRYPVLATAKNAPDPNR